jgi:hypothetical protein
MRRIPNNNSKKRHLTHRALASVQKAYYHMVALGKPPVNCEKKPAILHLQKSTLLNVAQYRSRSAG